jgi:quercetin dioxygenase-like cupin family protein
VLEGSLGYEIDGQPPTRVDAGEAVTVPAETVYAVRNVGAGNAAEARQVRRRDEQTTPQPRE